MIEQDCPQTITMTTSEDNGQFMITKAHWHLCQMSQEAKQRIHCNVYLKADCACGK